MYGSGISGGPPKPWRSAIPGDEGGRIPSSEDPTARFELIHPLGKQLGHINPVTLNLWLFHPLIFSLLTHSPHSRQAMVPTEQSGKPRIVLMVNLSPSK